MPRIRRTWRARWPSAMNPATPNCNGVGQCQSRQFLAATRVRSAQSGATMKPSRSADSMHLEESADVEHHIGGIDGAECFEGTAVVAEFTVVVVFDDDRAVAARELDQRLAAAHRHRHAERELVG